MKAGSREAWGSAPGRTQPGPLAPRTVVRLFPPRRYLFLQGVPGPFMHTLGTALHERGHAVLRVNFNGGDRQAWPRLPAVDFSGELGAWPAFLHRLVRLFRPTDIVLHGDCRPLHAAAIGIANDLGIVAHVFEEGYLRPDWITLEVGGVNGHSRLPRDVSAYRAAAACLPAAPPFQHVPPSVRARARVCLKYAAASLAMRPWFPRYATHRGWPLLREGAGWLKRAVRGPFAKRRSQAAVAAAFAAPAGFFVLPIQMDNDSQILCHSDLGGMTAAIRLAVASFAAHAPAGSVLAVKEHPLDNGVIDWRRVSEAAARDAGVADRVVLIEDCDLQELLDRALGLVTVNSTSATFAIASGVPVIALGRAVYNLPGLTHQGCLDSFWTAPERPDRGLFEAFRRTVMHACLIPGDFFTPDGAARAAAGAVSWLEAGRDAATRVEAVARHRLAQRA